MDVDPGALQDSALDEALGVRDLPAVLAGAQRCFSALLRQRARGMGLSPEACEDCVQETLLRVAEAFPRFRGALFGRWVMTLGHYVMLGMVRDGARARARHADAPPDPPAPESDAVELREVEEAVEAVLRGVQDPVTLLIGRHLGDELGDTELAELIRRTTGEEVAVGAIRARRFRLRARILERMRARGVS